MSSLVNKAFAGLSHPSGDGRISDFAAHHGDEPN
jgi:hypothetical protein